MKDSWESTRFNLAYIFNILYIYIYLASWGILFSFPKKCPWFVCIVWLCRQKCNMRLNWNWTQLYIQFVKIQKNGPRRVHAVAFLVASKEVHARSSSHGPCLAGCSQWPHAGTVDIVAESLKRPRVVHFSQIFPFSSRECLSLPLHFTSNNMFLTTEIKAW